MRRIINLLCHCLVVLVLCATLNSMATAANNFVYIKLPHGAQIELPKNWKTLSGNQMITLDSFVQSSLEKVGVLDVSSDLDFAANYYDEAKKTAALMNVRYTISELTQTDASLAGEKEVLGLDNMVREGIAKEGKAAGYYIVSWSGTSKRNINGATAFVTEYMRSSINNNGKFKVILVRVLNGGKSFTMTISYREDQEYLLRPICERIISSLVI